MENERLIFVKRFTWTISNSGTIKNVLKLNFQNSNCGNSPIIQYPERFVNLLKFTVSDKSETHMYNTVKKVSCNFNKITNNEETYELRKGK